MTENKILQNLIDYIKAKKEYKKDKKNHVRGKLKNTKCYDCKYLKSEVSIFENYCRIRKEFVFDCYTTRRCEYCKKRNSYKMKGNIKNDL